jgi:hypothetical protein
VVDDNFLVLGLLCYHWLSFYNHESSLHRVFAWFLLIVCFFLKKDRVYLCSFLPCTFDGWVPHLLIFIYRVFLLIHQEKLSKLAFIIVTQKRFHPFTITFFESTVPSDPWGVLHDVPKWCGRICPKCWWLCQIMAIGQTQLEVTCCSAGPALQMDIT